ncbi:pyridoxal phosphate-dependent aminotransferase [Athalassotoga saccharophila]|uniref:pyridoxal phosphate-dependent aminotransferase n=1 Tax=Athalassotoga saccharophila TaxID=1441386 RepID=UPI00137ABFF2|nr:pyridoxal phosphate-dependent aminotransferase [Athalassotoga saccharophila]BBJ27420.1 aspartate aminotransferase [Athalassotoga saccharophila]
MERYDGLSKRAKELPASPIRKLVPYADEAKKRGIKVYHLNIGQPDLKTPQVYFDRIRSFSGIDDYTNSAGLMELREKFSEYYKKWSIPFEASEIIITEGGSEAVSFAIAAVADPGDDVMVIEPFYANYSAFAKFLGVNVVPVTSKAEDGYRMPSVEKFERSLTPKTRAILFPNPGNPNGVVYTKDELEMIMDFAVRNDLYIISDEVYREITFDGLKAHSMMDFGNHERVIIADSLSKRFNICGARIGAIASKNKRIMESVMKMAMARLAANHISQYGAIGLFDLDKNYFKEMVSEYQKRRDVVYNELKNIPGIIMNKPEGAFYLAAKLPVDDSEEFVKWMLQNFSYEGKTTMVAPLGGFYVTPNMGKNEIRIAYVLNSEDLKDACRILARGIEEYSKEKVFSKR